MGLLAIVSTLPKYFRFSKLISTLTYIFWMPKITFLCQGFQKLEPKQDMQTHTQTDATESITSPHLLVVKTTATMLRFAAACMDV